MKGVMEQIVLQMVGVFSGGWIRIFSFSKIYTLFTFSSKEKAKLKVPFTFMARARLPG